MHVEQLENAGAPPQSPQAVPITLSNGQVCLVDASDARWLRGHRWHALKGRTTTYAYRHDKDQATVYMHRVIMGVAGKSTLHVDHKNGDGLNNTRANLRVCTPGQNQANGGPRRHNRTGFKGVVRSGNGFGASIGFERRCQHLGTFATAEEAARAYDAAALRLYGEFARLNFPLPAEVASV